MTAEGHSKKFGATGDARLAAAQTKHTCRHLTLSQRKTPAASATLAGHRVRVDCATGLVNSVSTIAASWRGHVATVPGLQVAHTIQIMVPRFCACRLHADTEDFTGRHKSLLKSVMKIYMKMQKTNSKLVIYASNLTHKFELSFSASL